MSTKSLFVLSGGRKFGPMAREDVTKLVNAGRLAPSDLVSALDSPWMRLEDFLGVAPPRIAPVRAQPIQDSKLPLTFAEDEPIPELDFPVVIEGPLSDNWQVIVRKIPSANLSVHNLQQLLEAREIDFDSKVNHETWCETMWIPIRRVPQLCKFLNPPPAKA